MNSQITYNLSSVPSFTNFIKTGEILPEFEKYYTLHQYFTKANEKYMIVRYNKEFLHSDLVSTYGLLRSVIFSDSKVVCFAPPKSLSGENFMLQYHIKTEHIIDE